MKPEICEKCEYVEIENNGEPICVYDMLCEECSTVIECPKDADNEKIKKALSGESLSEEDKC